MATISELRKIITFQRIDSISDHHDLSDSINFPLIQLRLLIAAPFFPASAGFPSVYKQTSPVHINASTIGCQLGSPCCQLLSERRALRLPVRLRRASADGGRLASRVGRLAEDGWRCLSPSGHIWPTRPFWERRCHRSDSSSSGGVTGRRQFIFTAAAPDPSPCCRWRPRSRPRQAAPQPAGDRGRRSPSASVDSVRASCAVLCCLAPNSSDHREDVT